VVVVRHPIGKFMAWSKTHQGRKLIRFTSVSVVSTAVSAIVIFLVYGLKIIKGEVEATLFGNLVAAIPSYQLNRKWTWGKSGRSHWRKEVLPFACMTALGIGFSLLGASYARHLVHTHHWDHLVNTGLVVVANLVSFGIFWVLKLMVFNRIFRVDEASEIETHLNEEETPPASPSTPNA
jgi:putative flippase GtrA